MGRHGRVEVVVLHPLISEAAPASQETKAVVVPPSDYLIGLWDATERALQEEDGTAERRTSRVRLQVARASVESVRPYSYD